MIRDQFIIDFPKDNSIIKLWFIYVIMEVIWRYTIHSMDTPFKILKLHLLLLWWMNVFWYKICPFSPFALSVMLLLDKICLCSPLGRSVKILLKQIYLFSPLVEAVLILHSWNASKLITAHCVFCSNRIFFYTCSIFPPLCQLGFVCGRFSVDRLFQTRWHQASLGPTLVERGGVCHASLPGLWVAADLWV